MDKLRYFSEDLDVQSKYVIVRLDLNVPLIEKNSRHHELLINLPLLNHLIKNKGKSNNNKSFG